MKGVNFFTEAILRFKTKNPAFFRKLQIVCVIITVICGLPAALAEHGVHMPEAFMTEANKYIAIASAAVAFFSQFTTDTPRATEAVLDNIAGGADAATASKNV